MLAAVEPKVLAHKPRNVARTSVWQMDGKHFSSILEQLGTWPEKSGFSGKHNWPQQQANALHKQSVIDLSQCEALAMLARNARTRVKRSTARCLLH